MKVFYAKILALGGLCALFAGIGNGASAQGYMRRDTGDGHHRMVRHARRNLQHLHGAYARAINNGNRAAAERAHLRANAIRARLRAHRRARR